MKQERIQHRKLNLFVLIVIFLGLYLTIDGIIYILNESIQLGAGPIITQILFLYCYLMFILRHQLHSFSYTLEDGHLIIKDILSRRHKTLVIVPLNQILSIEEEQQKSRRSYHKVLRTRKSFIKNLKRFYIEYDDGRDMSLIEITCTKDFMKEVCSHI